jgi:integrase
VILPDGPAAKKTPLTVGQLRALLDAAKARGPVVHAAIAMLSMTGIRKCHILALRWGDVDEDAGVIRFKRRVYRGNVSDVTRKKYVPPEYPLPPQLAAILRLARAPGADAGGWAFPGKMGRPLTAAWLAKTFGELARAVGLEGVSPHGLRYTWKDLARAASVDHVVAKALTGHSRDAQHERYSTVRPAEAAAAVGRVLKLVRGGRK